MSSKWSSICFWDEIVALLEILTSKSSFKNYSLFMVSSFEIIPYNFLELMSLIFAMTLNSSLSTASSTLSLSISRLFFVAKTTSKCYLVLSNSSLLTQLNTLVSSTFIWNIAFSTSLAVCSNLCSFSSENWIVRLSTSPLTVLILNSRSWLINY